MLTLSLLLFGAVLLALVLVDRPLRALPLTPAVIYLAVGWATGAVLGAPRTATLEAHAPAWVLGTELAVLVSLFAVGLRLRVPPRPGLWRVALLLAGPGMVLTIVLGALGALLLLDMPWGAALLLASILAPTDPVLASEVQIRADDDRDAVRLSLTAEGGLNDGTALPAVMLALGLLGLHDLGEGGALGSLRWWALDLAWPIGGGALLGGVLGRVMGEALKARVLTGDRLARDELLYAAAVALAFGAARATHTSTFIVMFTVGVTLLEPLHRAVQAGAAAPHPAAPGGQVLPHHALREGGQALSARMHAFGARVERLAEAATVLAVGVGLHIVAPDWRTLAWAALLVCVVRPLSVLCLVHRSAMAPQQRRLVAWFGIRGIGSLFYLAYALQHGLGGGLAVDMVGTTLVAIALSIVLHGVSATPLMNANQVRRGRRQPPA